MTRSLALFIRATLLALPGCAAVITPPALSNLAISAIAQDMVHVLSLDWPRAQTHITLDASSHATFDAALRQAGFAIDPVPEADSIPAYFRFHPLLDDSYLAVLDVNRSWQLSRLYRLVRGRLEPAAAFTLKGGRGIQAPIPTATWAFTDSDILTEEVPPEVWFVDVLTTLDRPVLDKATQAFANFNDYPVAVIPALGSAELTLRIGPITRPVSARNVLGEVRVRGFDKAKLIASQEMVVIDVPKAAPPLPTPPKPCTQMTLKRGSLRTNVERLADSCGYSLAGWYLDATGDSVDWVIKKPFAFTTNTGVYGLLDFLLNTYGIEAIAHPATKLISVRKLRP